MCFLGNYSQKCKNFLFENGRPRQKAAGKRRRFPAGLSDFFAHSYDFPIKWLTPFYPANPSQAAGSGEKCMNLRFLRLRRRLLKQQPDKAVKNRFIRVYLKTGKMTNCEGFFA